LLLANFGHEYTIGKLRPYTLDVLYWRAEACRVNRQAKVSRIALNADYRD
tara:strand:+ start:1656 stop:1805 length:150 start_codon:yes stop_codon:yes gene_type:complete